MERCERCPLAWTAEDLAGNILLPMQASDSATLLHTQPGRVEGQLGALRRLCFGDVGFVEQLDALDDDECTMCAQHCTRSAAAL